MKNRIGRKSLKLSHDVSCRFKPGPGGVYFNQRMGASYVGWSKSSFKHLNNFFVTNRKKKRKSKKY